jgi:ketosteroid isomerase-like protein
MQCNAEDIVCAYYAAWAQQDLDVALALFAEDITIVVHPSSPGGPRAAPVRNKAQAAARMRAVADEWEFLERYPLVTHVNRDRLRGVLNYRYRHRRSGGIIEGTCRMSWRVRDGLIVRIDQSLDTALFRAFLHAHADASASTEFA